MSSASTPVPAVLDHIAETGIDQVPEHDDPLTSALRDLSMDGVFYCRSELTAPWGLTLPPMPDCLWFHIVVAGEALLLDRDGEGNGDGGAHELVAGDIVLFPRGGGHRAADGPSTATPVVFDLPHQYLSRHYAILRHGGGGPRTDIICGLVHLANPAARMLLGALPSIVRPSRLEQWDWLPPVLALMAEESRNPRLGSETLLTRLSDVVIIQSIRAWIEASAEEHGGWLRALRDPQIGRAMSLIHQEPAHPWTVASLAATVGMSRSNLSARFTELVGLPPKQYLTRWRMQLAEDLLRDQDRTLADIARSLGYQSEAAFSRAFKRETGSAPSQARRSADVIELGQERATGALPSHLGH